MLRGVGLSDDYWDMNKNGNRTSYSHLSLSLLLNIFKCYYLPPPLPGKVGPDQTPRSEGEKLPLRRILIPGVFFEIALPQRPSEAASDPPPQQSTPCCLLTYNKLTAAKLNFKRKQPRSRERIGGVEGCPETIPRMILGFPFEMAARIYRGRALRKMSYRPSLIKGRAFPHNQIPTVDEWEPVRLTSMKNSYGRNSKSFNTLPKLKVPTAF
ncbi:hypothetical protein CEXT_339431 [Caerostris extrusa]|uniref:Uncharacterized protein n=1 Tax=Caerostris extrusa TaxID=172846 RepID=A0AAV4TRC3_CAEEX|nr:hypothetical protein CEXT_339431 [Caerostris extrusa]